MLYEVITMPAVSSALQPDWLSMPRVPDNGPPSANPSAAENPISSTGAAVAARAMDISNATWSIGFMFSSRPESEG